MPQPQYLERDPDALATLLRGQTQFPRYTDEEEQLQSMIPEEALYQAQEAQADRGMARGGPYSVSSRDSLRDSGMANLRQLFGMQHAEAQAKAYPAQVTGEYNLGRERIRAQGNVESAKVRGGEARLRENNISGRQSQQQQFQQSQQERQQAFQGQQGELNREAIAGRNTASIAGRQTVAETGNAGRAATQASIDARKSGGKNEYWGPEALGPLWKRMFGGADPAASATTPPSAAAAELAPLLAHPKYASLPFESLLQQGIVSGTPEEIESYRQVWEQR